MRSGCEPYAAWVASVISSAYTDLIPYSSVKTPFRSQLRTTCGPHKGTPAHTSQIRGRKRYSYHGRS